MKLKYLQFRYFFNKKEIGKIYSRYPKKAPKTPHIEKKLLEPQTPLLCVRP